MTEFDAMSSTSPANRGNLALTLLRFGVLATAGIFAGVVAHVMWRLVSG
ncbi:hypothetical protein [Sediminicoccus sp. BL-A-41-H5]|jgi:hypothetical protein